MSHLVPALAPSQQHLCRCPPHVTFGCKWGVPIFGVLGLSILYGVPTLWSLRKHRSRMFLEFMFLLNVAIETGVAMRCQLPHTGGVTKMHGFLTIVSSGLALICFLWDSVKKYRKVVPLGNQMSVARYITTYDYALFFNLLAQLGFRLAETVLRYTCGDSCSIPKCLLDNDFSVVPLLLAIATWASRRFEHSKVTDNSINIMFIGGGVVGQGGGLVGGGGAVVEGQGGGLVGGGGVVFEGQGEGQGGGQNDRGVDDEGVEHEEHVNVVVDEIQVEQGNPNLVGQEVAQGNPNLVGQEAAQGNPNLVGQGNLPGRSPLVNGIIEIGKTQDHNFNCFNVWSTTVARVEGDITLNLWEINSEITVGTNWMVPSVDYVVIYFSLVDEASYRNVMNTWVPLLKNRASSARKILVGTEPEAREQRITKNNQEFYSFAEGEKLAKKAKAVAYIECNMQNSDQKLKLVNTLAKLKL